MASIEIDGLWMRTAPGTTTGEVQVLIRHEGRWKVAFGSQGAMAHGPTAHDTEQLLDHCIHPLGLERIAASEPLPPPPEYKLHARARRRR